jgi:hypothetical protein
MNSSEIGGPKKKISCNYFIIPSLNDNLPAIRSSNKSINDLVKIIKTRTLTQIKSKINRLRYNQKHHSNFLDNTLTSMKDLRNSFLDIQDNEDQKYITLTDSLSLNKITVSLELLLDILTLPFGVEEKSRSVTLNKFYIKELVGRKKMKKFYTRAVDYENR